MIIKQNEHHTVICDQFIELITNAGTMLQCKGFRAAKAYLTKEIYEAYFASIEQELIDKKARQCDCFFNLLAFNGKKMKSTGQMVTFLIHAYENFADYKVHYQAQTIKQKSNEKINLNLFAEMLAKIQ